MDARRLLRALLVTLMVLVPATPAFANSLASWVWIWPGVLPMDPLFGLVPTVLVAFVERPFVSRAGVHHRPLFRSIRANLLSLLAGIPLAFTVWSLHSQASFFLFTGVAVAVTIGVELWYFRSVAREEDRTLRWGWIVLGNLASNALLIVLAILIKTLQANYPELGRALMPYQRIEISILLTFSLSMVIAALAGPVVRVVRLSYAVEELEPYPHEAWMDRSEEDVKISHAAQPDGQLSDGSSGSVSTPEQALPSSGRNEEIHENDHVG